MWTKNALTERLTLKAPIFQAPMGSISTPALAAAVSNAGGIGGLGMWGFSAADARRRIQGFRQQSGGALNVNYPLWDHPGDISDTGQAMRAEVQRLYDLKGAGAVPDPQGTAGTVDAEHLEMLIQMKPEVISFHFGLPDAAVLHALRAAGIFIICSATTVAEARVLQERGVDAIIAQGAEAGGHRGTFTGVDISLQPGLFALLPQVVDAVDVPVIAAGGIADGRGIAAALMMGASGVQMGTAFLRAHEANVSDTYRDALAQAGDNNTVVTSVLSGRPARALRNDMVGGLMDSGASPLPFPAQGGLTGGLGEVGDWNYATSYVGQAFKLSRDVPATQLVEALIEETNQRLMSVT